MKHLLLAVLLLFSALGYAQKKKSKETSTSPFTPAGQRWNGFEQFIKMKEASLVKEVPFRNVGPTIMSGRVVDVDVNPSDPAEFYVAYASGGLWHTVSNGMSFKPVFDHEAVLTIGDIAVDWTRRIIWVGTGENNSSRSSYAGMGLYRSDNGGQNWNYLGLGESHHIGRIVLDENDPAVAWVAVLGHLYSENKERGVYKTTDGGKTWKHTLAINDSTGCIDLVRDPNHGNILYTAAWHRNRRAWNFEGSGHGTGIYRSDDGGETWKKVTASSNGFPTGKGAGRIGLASVNNAGNTTVYAVIDNQFIREKKKEADSTQLTKDKLRGMDMETFLKLNKKQIGEYLTANGFPEKYTADTVLTLVRNKTISPQALVEYLEDANSLLFDSDVTGAEVYRSDDGGATWKKTHEGYLDDLFYTYGYYFSQIRTVPGKPEDIYVLGFVVIKSENGGKSFRKVSKESNVHVDHHALWVNPSKPDHLVNGNDGGVNITYDDGQSWIKCNNPPVGQFYSVNVDMEKPYHIFGGLQDNGVWWGPSSYASGSDWHQSGAYPYKEIMSGDGMQVAVDTRGNNVIYTGYQFGNYFRVNLVSGSSKYITPVHELGERPYRWNWQSPIQLSPHHSDLLYFGAERVFRSLNRGDEFKAISGDLTNGGKKGNVPYGTLTTLFESPLKFGLLYAGTDDGKLWMTQDGGNSWKSIYNDLPAHLWVSRVHASAFKEGRVYVSLNGYRWDDFKAYLYASEDYGATWTRLGLELPLEPVNVFKEDPVNENVLYAGTDAGVYVSLDRGKTFMPFSKGLPRVAVHDLVIHPRDRELVLGTHGRSFYIASVREVQQLHDSMLQKPLVAFNLEPVDFSRSWGQSGFDWDTASVPSVQIPVYLSSPGEIRFSLYGDSSMLLRQWNAVGVKGLNYISFDLSIDSMQKEIFAKWLNKELKEEDQIKLKAADNGKYYLNPGTYQLVMESGQAKTQKEFVIRKPQ